MIAFNIIFQQITSDFRFVFHEVIRSLAKLEWRWWLVCCSRVRKVHHTGCISGGNIQNGYLVSPKNRPYFPLALLDILDKKYRKHGTEAIVCMIDLFRCIPRMVVVDLYWRGGSAKWRLTNVNTYSDLSLSLYICPRLTLDESGIGLPSCLGRLLDIQACVTHVLNVEAAQGAKIEHQL